MRFTFRSSCLLLAMTAFLLGCQPTVQNSAEDTSEKVNSEKVNSEKVDSEQVAVSEEKSAAEEEAIEKIGSVSEEPTGINVNLKAADKRSSRETPVSTNSASPETYCYQIRSDYWNHDVIMTVDSQNRVVGRKIEENYESYEMDYTEISGEIVDGIVYANETSNGETLLSEWPFNPEEIYFSDEYSLQAIDCAPVITRFQESEGSVASEIVAAASSVRTNRIAFDSGKSSTTVSDSAVIGERIENFLVAAAGQEMSLSISSVEDNAVFDIIDPSGLLLGKELKEKTVVLPHSGNYRIIVGSKRGNARYDLNVNIQ